MSKQAKISNFCDDSIHFYQGEVLSNHTWRKRVLKRDNNKCQYCFGSLKDPFRKRKPLLEAHHIIARRHGGRNTLANGVTLCTFCHDYFDYMYSKHNVRYDVLISRDSDQRRLNAVKNLMRRKYITRLISLVNE